MKKKKELKIMKTTMRQIIFICLLALANVAQAWEYQPFSNSITSMPSSQFHSTSAYSEQWKDKQEQLMLNADGSVNAEAYGVGQNYAPGLRKVTTPNPGVDDDDPGNVPIGDAVIPLLLIALMYILVKNRKKYILFFALLAFASCSPQKAEAVDYTSAAVIESDTVRYSKLVINSCLAKFKANTSYTSFQTYNEDGSVKDARATGTSSQHSKSKIDYVPGLVAKALIECVDYYKDSTWARPWFYSVEWYGSGTGFYSSIETSGASLDNLNAVKLYFKLKELAPTLSANSATTVANCNTALSLALTGLGNTNSTYSIKAGTVDGTNNANALPKPGGGTYDVTGGWYHKSDYTNQLWCDGQYMGPALLAQYVADGQTLEGKTADECWDIIVKQFDITWTYLWNSTDQLLYHAFCADGGTNSTTRSTDWAALTVGSCYHSAEYWGRAEGWYVLALVDVIEQMDKAGLSSDPRRTRLLGYLQECAAGLLRWQDATTGCWYQLLGHDGEFSVTDYKTKDGLETIKTGTKSNYLESSATAIFTATLLKGMRLGYLSKATYETAAKKAYHGFLKQFLRTSIDGNAYGLINCCASAGLGGKSGSDRRTGSAAYYLLGSDVTKVTSYTEGKVLGAFILAAVEYERAYPPEAAAAAGSECNCLRVSVSE